jgi:two-component sensor histidine kinase
MSEPSRRGFGSQPIEAGITKDVDGETELRFAPSGLQWRMAFLLRETHRLQ